MKGNENFAAEVVLALGDGVGRGEKGRSFGEMPGFWREREKRWWRRSPSPGSEHLGNGFGRGFQ